MVDSWLWTPAFAGVTFAAFAGVTWAAFTGMTLSDFSKEFDH